MHLEIEQQAIWPPETVTVFRLHRSCRFDPASSRLDGFRFASQESSINRTAVLCPMVGHGGRQ